MWSPAGCIQVDLDHCYGSISHGIWWRGFKSPLLCLPTTQSSPRSLNFFHFPISPYLSVLSVMSGLSGAYARIGDPHTHTHTVRQTAVGLGWSAGDLLSEELTGWSDCRPKYGDTSGLMWSVCVDSVCVLEALTLLYLLVSSSKNSIVKELLYLDLIWNIQGTVETCNDYICILDLHKID